MNSNTYYASSDPHTSGSGFVNFFGKLSGDNLNKLHQRMVDELGEHVIVDGDDNWFAPEKNRPEVFVRHFASETGCEVLARYHSGISGISFTGVVLRPEDFDRMTEWYKEKYGVEMDANPELAITSNSNSTAL